MPSRAPPAAGFGRAAIPGPGRQAAGGRAVDWWNEYATKAAKGYDPGIMMAKTSLVAYTWTETMQSLEPIGVDRWPYELALKYGIRDALTCCVGQRWLVAYWSRQVLCNLRTRCASF